MRIIILGLSLAACAAWTQAPPRPEFAVASIKPDPGCNKGGVISPGRLEWSCVTLEFLIRQAYVAFADGKKVNPKAMDIEGGPSWIRSETYSVAAKADGPAALPLMAGPMLQVLLEDRFKIKVHIASKEVSGYDLVPARQLKLQPSKASCAVFPDKSSSLEVRREEVSLPLCGNLTTSAVGSKLVMEGRATKGAILADVLSSYVNRPVIDKTGFAQKFDLHLEFTDPESPTADADGPSIFEALNRQLGLKLVSTRVPVHYLVVDHAERLTDKEQ